MTPVAPGAVPIRPTICCPDVLTMMTSSPAPRCAASSAAASDIGQDELVQVLAHHFPDQLGRPAEPADLGAYQLHPPVAGPGEPAGQLPECAADRGVLADQAAGV
jgi:hypothetical protein